MGKTIHEQRLDYVSSHFDQTALVEDLLRLELVHYDDIYGWVDDEQ